MNIFNELKNNFKYGNVLTRLIYINVGVFIIVNLISIFFLLIGLHVNYQNVVSFLFYFPSNFHAWIYKPWTIITYMFIHADIWHILFNMLWLYWFGQIFLMYLSHKQLLSIYIMGGISGAILYSLAYSILPYFSLEMKYSSVIGASASIMAIVIAISAIIPNYSVNLFLFGSVRLKYLAIITIIIDIISIQYGNPGGHIAHLGGGLFGYWFGIRYNKGKDITLAFSKIFLRKPSFFKKKSKIKIMYQRPVSDFEYNKQKADIQRELDRILDKISKSGYNSLTKEEKDFLASKK